MAMFLTSIERTTRGYQTNILKADQGLKNIDHVCHNIKNHNMERRHLVDWMKWCPIVGLHSMQCGSGGRIPMFWSFCHSCVQTMAWEIGRTVHSVSLNKCSLVIDLVISFLDVYSDPFFASHKVLCITKNHAGKERPLLSPIPKPIYHLGATSYLCSLLGKCNWSLQSL